MALDGQSGYNKMVMASVEADSKKKIDTLKASFNSTSNQVESLIHTYNSLSTNYNYTKELYEKLYKENEKNSKALKKIRGDIITSDRKTYYEQQSIDGLLTVYSWLRFAYIILLILFIVVVILKVRGWIVKILILLFFIFYPIFIEPLTLYIVKCLQFIINLILPKNV